jgi:hypothetical protein
MFWRVRVLVLIGVLILAAAGCVNTDNIKDAVNAIVPKIDNVIAEINKNSLAWQGLLQGLMTDIKGLENKFTKDAQDTVRLAANQIDATLENAVGAAGAEVQCQVDLLQAKLRRWLVQQLQYIKSVLLHKADATAPEGIAALPYVCNNVPVSLDMEPALRQNTVIFWGNDLSSPGMQFALRYNGTHEVTFPASLVASPSNYKITLNTSPVDNTLLCNKSARQIVLRYNNQDIAAMTVNTAACKTPTAPPVAPEKVRVDQAATFVAIMRGLPQEQVSPPATIGMACTPNYQQSRITAVTLAATTAGGWCEVGWISSDTRNCQVRVTPHYTPQAQAPTAIVSCQVTIFEIGIPQPPPDPCPCW